MSDARASRTGSGKEESSRNARAVSAARDQLDIFSVIDDVWKGLRRFWLEVLLTVSLFSSVFFWYGKTQVTPLYEASCTFLVNTSSSVNYSSSYYSARAASQIAKTFPYIIKNDALKKIIENDLGVSEIPGTISATAVPDTNMMTVKVQSEDKQAAYDILQSVLRNYGSVAKAVMGETDLTMMNESGIPTVPVNLTGGRRFGAYGFLTGAFLWALFFALQSYFKKTVRSQDDFTKLLSVKCLGATPKVRVKKRTRKKNHILVTDPYVSYGFVEGIRTLRIRVERRQADSGDKVFLVSSALAGEGKSTIAANLALSLADRGMKVFLMDLDFRNSSVMKVLGKEEPEDGLQQVLEGTKVIRDILVKDEATGLSILPAGKSGKNMAQMINSVRLAKVFELLKSMGDYVIVDTPPSSILSDAASLAKYADAGIFVVRQDYAPVERIREGVDLLADSGLEIAGCMLNYAQAGISDYAYGYGYGYGSGRYGSRYGKYGGYGQKRRRRERQDSSESRNGESVKES